MGGMKALHNLASETPPPGAVVGTPSDGGTMPSRSATPARSESSAGGLEMSAAAGVANTSVPGMGAGPVSGTPPSRPATGMSNASSIDDLLGAPSARKGGTVGKKGKKGGRYVDVMANK